MGPFYAPITSRGVGPFCAPVSNGGGGVRKQLRNWLFRSSEGWPIRVASGQTTLRKTVLLSDFLERPVIQLTEVLNAEVDGRNRTTPKLAAWAICK